MNVLSAVRTPLGLLNGSLCEFSAGQLSATVFREAMERAVVPCEDVQHLFVGCALSSNFDKETMKRISLPKSTKILTSKCSLECFVKACKFIQEHSKSVCLVGGVESASNNILFNKQNSLEVVIKSIAKSNAEKLLSSYLSNQVIKDQIQTQSYKNYITAYKNNAFYDELVKIDFRKKGYQIIVTEDEQIKSCDLSQKMQTNSKNLLFPGDGAAAALIAGEEYVKKNQLTPLAKIISFASESINAGEYFSIISQIIKKALGNVGFQSQSISMWEINAFNHSIVSSTVNQLKINPSLINKDGDIFSLGFPIGMYGGKMVSHIIHSLSPGQFGCAASLSIDGTASAVVLKKECIKTLKKPQLTLYSKKMCPLCDDLEKQLEPYKNRISFQKINIELSGNEKFKNLYLYEIPVLFLDGTFLCKHKLDLKHFIRRLCQSEDNHCNISDYNLCPRWAAFIKVYIFVSVKHNHRRNCLGKENIPDSKKEGT